MKSEFKLVSLLKNRKPFQKLYIVELYLFFYFFFSLFRTIGVRIMSKTIFTNDTGATKINRKCISFLLKEGNL